MCASSDTHYKTNKFQQLGVKLFNINVKRAKYELEKVLLIGGQSEHSPSPGAAG